MNFPKERSCSRFRNQYVPPYERLLRRFQKWKPKKFDGEKKLQKLCKEGRLIPFQQPENYSCYFIHEKTEIQLVDDLIDQGRLTIHYSIDTEGDPFLHRPAILQVEFIRHDAPSIVIIMEASYLPRSTSPLLRKIQQLWSIIFTTNNHIYSWGPALKELEQFNANNLFNSNIIIYDHDVQEKFSGGELYSLQAAIKFEFGEYLNKTATLAEWACGIDLYLDTYIPKDSIGPERRYRINEEKKYRAILKQYAINDVFAVTRLIYQINLSNSLTPPLTSGPEPSLDHETLDNAQEQSIELKPLDENEIYYKIKSSNSNIIKQGSTISIGNEIKILNNLDIYENISDDKPISNMNKICLYDK